MAAVNKTRIGKANQKGKLSLASVELDFSDLPSLSDYYEIFSLPANCLITSARVFVKVAGQATSTVDIGVAGGDTLGNGLVISSIGVVGDVLTAAVDTGSGMLVTIRPMVAIPATGTFIVTLEYQEYTRTNGEHLNFSTT